MLSEFAMKESQRQDAVEVSQRPVAAARGSAKNRGRLDTVAEIVNSCVGGANKSRIMLTANVNSVVATELINKLITSRLLVPRKADDGNSMMYYPTQEGLDFVRKYSDLTSMLLPGMVPPTRISDAGRSAQTWI
jgi:predicted transcriptional regulator